MPPANTFVGHRYVRAQVTTTHASVPKVCYDFYLLQIVASPTQSSLSVTHISSLNQRHQAHQNASGNASPMATADSHLVLGRRKGEPERSKASNPILRAVQRELPNARFPFYCMQAPSSHVMLSCSRFLERERGLDSAPLCRSHSPVLCKLVQSKFSVL